MVAAKSVQQTFEELTNGELHEFRIGLIHGRMSPDEKQSAMDEFRSGHTQVLVSTSVVEVGVDVPNATVMVIDSAERFGLAQLHQLRGRIARGRHPGFCGVLLGEATDEARKRLQAFSETSDGFELAEIDFAMRGPGDLFGKDQHGLPPLRIADLRRDAAVLAEARQAARRLVAADPGFKRPEHRRLRHLLLARYGRVIQLGDVG